MKQAILLKERDWLAKDGPEESMSEARAGEPKWRGKVFTHPWGKQSSTPIWTFFFLFPFNMIEGHSFPLLSDTWPRWVYFSMTVEEALANRFCCVYLRKFLLFSLLFQGYIKVMMGERAVMFGLSPCLCLVTEPSNTFRLSIPLIFSQITDPLVGLKE